MHSWVLSAALAITIVLSSLVLILVDGNLLRSVVAGGAPTAAQLGTHEATRAFVTGGAAEVPAEYSAAERAHLADVRRLIRAGKFLLIMSLVVLLTAWGTGSRQAFWRAGLFVLGLTLVLAVLGRDFQAFWLRFHELFFPQGNFLFPRTSLLITLYPESFWRTLAMHEFGALLSFGLLSLFAGALTPRYSARK